MRGLVWMGGTDRRTQLPPGWKGLEGHRDARWEWELLDLEDGVVDYLGSSPDPDDPNGPRQGVVKGKLDLNENAQTRGTGQMRWVGTPGAVPDWKKHRVRPWYTASFPDGTSVRWPMGVYIAATPVQTYAPGAVSIDADLYDKTLILRRDAVEATFAAPAGVLVTDLIRSIIADSVGSGLVALTDSEEVLRTGMTWKAGTSKLKIVNDLLSAIGFFSIAADGLGTLFSRPYQRPSSRRVEWAFTDGPAGVYTEDFKDEHDEFNTPNKVVLISTESADKPALRATATLDEIAPDHDLAKAQLGHWVTRVEEGVEATSQAVLDAKADRLIRQSLQTARQLEIRHAPLPLTVLDRVTFRRDQAALKPVDGILQTISIPCDGTSLWSTTIREATT